MPAAGPSAPLHAATTGLPLDLTPEQRRAGILASLRKAVMGRAESARDVARVSDEIGPLVAAACAQPDVQPVFAQIASDQGITPDQAREQWAHLQEADILLESGGDPEAVSSAGAVGVSQWMPGAGTHGTLAINTKASAALTAQIAPLEWKVAWLQYWQHPEPSLRSAPPAGIPRASTAEASEKLPEMEAQLETLRAKRRIVDTRYDPPKAIQAQTRYLLNLYNRFPSADWLFQAYHGGEAGVERLLSRYLGPQWPGSAASAIRSGNSGNRVTFEDVYLSASPSSHPEAFLYLFGRGDDHRHYWWKLLVAEEAIALYRQNPDEFRKQWLALGPGHATESIWYPGATEMPLLHLGDIRQATTAGRLAPIEDTPFLTMRPAPLDKPHAAAYCALRPASCGALSLLAAAYRQAGGTAKLTVGDCAISLDYVNAKKQHFPAPPARFPMPPEAEISKVTNLGPPARFDYHTTGIPFDILRPTDRTQKKILEYTLGYFKDRRIMAWRDENVGTEPKHYHIVPNSAYAKEFEKITPGEPLSLPGL